MMMNRMWSLTSFCSLFSASICIIAYITGVYCSTQSPLEENGIQITYNISRDAVLTCTVKNKGRRRIIWRRLSDPFPIGVGGAKFNPAYKYRVSSRGDVSTLTIRRVRVSDAGEYLCEASGGAGPRETFTLNIKSGEDKVHFLKTDTKIVAKEGDTVLLPCHVENLDERMMVLWKDEKNQVVSLRKKELNGDHRFRVIHDTRTEWSMQIKKVREDDFGFFTCVVNTKPTMLTRTIELVNSEPARFSPVLMEDHSFRKRIEANPGETVSLKCSFNAYPPAEVTWLKRVKNSEGKVTRKEVGRGSTYTLRDVKPSEAGDYICTGDNGMGRPSKGKTRLIVKVPVTTPAPITTTTQFVPTGPASPRLYHAEHEVIQRRGRSTVLECIGVGQPRPRLEWQRHGHRLSKNYKYHLISRPDGPHRSILRLEIRSLTSRDYGEYECSGYNALGLKKIAFSLKQPS